LEVRALVVARLRSPAGVWAGDDCALTRGRVMDGVSALIEARRRCPPSAGR